MKEGSVRFDAAVSLEDTRNKAWGCVVRLILGVAPPANRNSYEDRCGRSGMLDINMERGVAGAPEQSIREPRGKVYGGTVLEASHVLIP